MQQTRSRMDDAAAAFGGIQSVDDLKATLPSVLPPPGLSPPLTALWLAAKTQFRTDDLMDIFAKHGAPFGGGGHLSQAEQVVYSCDRGSTAWYWLKAHTITQTIEYGFRTADTRDADQPSTWGDADLNWVHGHLHRLESDDRNAAGWYRR
jgi:hypothetical protein